MTDLRRISFVVEATATDLQQASAQAIEAIRAMARESATQSRTAAGANDRTIASNRTVARSYQTTAGYARNAAGAASSGARTQTAAAREVQAAAQRTTIVVRDAAVAQARASNTAAAAARRAAHSQAASAKHIENSFGKTDSAVSRFGRNSAIALAAVATGAAILDIKFETSMTKLRTQAGISLKQMNRLSDGILRMAPNVAEAPEELADALYHVVSSMDVVLPKATKVREELDILREAAKGAQIGGSNLEQTAYVLSSAMNALGKRGNEAGETMAALNAIVGTGDMRMSDLMGALSTGLIPAAENFGLSLQSVGAALAYLVDRGTPAQLAATRLRMSFALLGAPTQQSAKLLKSLGMGADDVRARTEAMTKALKDSGLRTTTLAADLRKPNGLAVALNDLNDHLRASGLNANASAALISRAFGGGRSGTAIMEMVHNTGVITEKFHQQTRVIDNYGRSWRGTQKTLAFQLREVTATGEQLATRLGEVVIPALNKFLKGVRDVFDWLQRNDDAANALALTFGGVLMVAMTAWFVSLGRRLGGALKEVGMLAKGFAAIPSRLENRIAGTSTTGRPGAASTTSTAGPIAALGGQRGGFGLPGSAANPLFVIPLGAGLGAPVPGGVAGGAARAGERVTPGGVILPNGVRSTVAAQGEQVAKTFAGSMRASLGRLVGGLARGAGVAGIGLMGAQLAGTAIGGDTGQKVSSIGSHAAIGAGVGAMVGPEGALAGAVIGGLVGLFRSISKNASEKLAEEATRGLGGELHDALQRSVGDELRTFRDLDPRPSKPKGWNDATFRVRPEPLSDEEFAKRRAAANRIGVQMARALEDGFSRYRFLNLGSMEGEFVERLRGLPVRSQQVAAKTMIAFARAMEKEGRLPRGATRQLIADLEAQYPALRAFLQQQGADSVRALALTFKNDEVEQSARAQIRRVGRTFQQLGDMLRETGGDTRFQWGMAMDFLVQQTRHGTREARRAAAIELAAMVGLSKRDAGAFAQWMAVGTSTAAISAATNLSGLTQVFAIALGDIAGQTRDISRTFGVKAINYVARHPKKVVATGLQAAIGLVGAITSAEGGWVGQPGERGHDTVRAVLGRGEAVVNRHQQGPLEVGLAVSKAVGAQPYGSLTELFRGERRAHYMASGGFAGGHRYAGGGFVHVPGDPPGPYGDSVNRAVEAIAAYFVNRYDLNITAAFDPGGRHKSPGHNVTGTAIDIVPGPGGSWDLVSRAVADAVRRGMTVYYDGSYGSTALANHGPGNHAHIELGSGNLSVEQVRAPRIEGPDSTLTRTANAAVRRATKAANTYLNRTLSELGGVGGGDVGSNFHGGSAAAKALARRMLAAYGWGADQWPPLDELWTRESGWNPNAVNPSSGAYGIPQSLGHGHPYDLGDAPAQIRWGLNYIRGRYGSPSAALSHHDAYNWYELGGFVEAAGGMPPASGTAGAGAGHAASGARAFISKAKQRASRKGRRHKGRRRHDKDPIARALAPFHTIPDVDHLPGNIDAITEHIGALSDQEGLLGTVAGNPRNFFVMPADMDTIGPTLQPGEDLHPGMRVVDAQTIQQRFAVRQTRENPLLDLQGQLLEWIASQASHQLLTERDVAVLASTVAATGVTPRAGETVAGTQVTNLNEQISSYRHQLHVERRAIRKINKAVRERLERRRLVDKLAHTTKKRMDAIERDLRKLTSRSLRERLAAARNNQASSRRIFDAQTERDQYSDLIAHERDREHPDQGQINAWEQRKRDLSSFIHNERGNSSGSVRAAEVALIRDRLSNEKRSLGEDLHKLTGNSTRIGTSGMLGRIRDDLSTLRGGRRDMEGDIAGILQSQLPAAKFERLAILDTLPEGDRPILPTSEGTKEDGDDSAIAALLRQQNIELAQNYALSQANYAVFSNFLPMIPKYAHGGRVQNTGFALVHEDEWISPSPKGPYGSQLATAAGGAGAPDIHLHLHGDLASMDLRMTQIADDRIERRAPRVVSLQTGTRARALAAAPGGRRIR